MSRESQGLKQDLKQDAKPKREAGPPRQGGGLDPRLIGLLAIIVVIGLAVLLAHVMSAVGHADQCLASGGRQC